MIWVAEERIIACQLFYSVIEIMIVRVSTFCHYGSSHFYKVGYLQPTHQESGTGYPDFYNSWQVIHLFCLVNREFTSLVLFFCSSQPIII